VVSIVIPVLNGAATLERCLNSVHAQSWPHELIVIDGGSSDLSVAILEAHAPRLAYWHSRPDRGVFHAWNQALDHVGGDWVLFLGADDYFVAPDSLARLARADDGAVDLITARAAIVDGLCRVRRVVGRAWSWEAMKRFQVTAPGTTLHRTALFAGGARFDEWFRIAGDYAFFLSLGRRVRAAFVNEVVVAVGNAGLSHTHMPRVFAEVFRIHVAHPEIGAARAAREFALAWAKYLARAYILPVLTLGRFRGPTGAVLIPPGPIA
jgi:glycosyltransferase involved in cell wall biosynthesis